MSDAPSRRALWKRVVAPLDGVPPGLQVMAVGAFSFSAMAALAKVAGRSVPLFEIVLARSAVMAVLSGAALVRSGTSFRGVDPGLLALRGLLGFGALTCFYYAVVHLPLADATVIHFMNPVFTALVAAVVLGEHLGVTETLLTVGSLSGVVMVARPSFLFGQGDALDPFAVGVALAGAVLAAGAYVTVRRLRGEAPMVIVFWFSAVSTLLAFPLVLRNPVAPDLPTLLVLLGVGLTTHVGQVLITYGFRLERAGRASAIGYLQIVFAAGWGWLLFREVPDAWTAAGAAVIVGCTMVLVRLHPVR